VVLAAVNSGSTWTYQAVMSMSFIAASVPFQLTGRRRTFCAITLHYIVRVAPMELSRMLFARMVVTLLKFHQENS
jgi:hypothetical protein